ncbi:MAG: tRNA (uridine(54)-C5)-methyltransferase TrmA [Enterobacteriaceae bacterium]
MSQTSQSDYQQQLADKQQRLAALMSPFSPPAIEVFPSEPQHYRMRAEFRIWHEGEDLYHIMFDPVSKQRVRIDHFPAASLLINRAMQKIMNALKGCPALRFRLFQIDYLSTLSEQLIVSLLYHRPLDQEWQQQASKLKQALTGEGINVQLIGRAAKMKICLDQDYVDEQLPVAGRTMIYRQVENCFTQPNARVNISMLEWALNATGPSNHDLLELYCGNGNFSLALARHFRQVLATEIAKSSVNAAQFNIAANGIDNVKIVRLSAEELTEAMQGVRQFNRLKGISLADYQFGTVLVDPPRSGLDQETLGMVQHYPRILYISCNPDTLSANLTQLTRSHRVSRLALFDQFPYTHHMECGVMLEKR